MKWPPFHPAARREFDHEVDYLEGRSSGLGRRFVRRTMEAVVILREFPRSGQPIGRYARRFALHPFPYDLVYLPEEEDIYVIAFAHHRRRPGYWRQRL